MTPASPRSLALARELLALEAACENELGSSGNASSASASAADGAARVCDRLRGVLTAFTGAEGFRSLLTRALTLASAQDLSLAGVKVGDDGALRIETPQGNAVPDATRKAGHGADRDAGGGILVAHLLDLLIIFIGESLTLQMLRTAWPDAPSRALRRGPEEKL